MVSSIKFGKVGTLEVREEPNLSEFPYLFAECLSVIECFEALEELENNFTLREGYSITANGSCSKGPQGQWWEFRIEFESKEGSDLGFKILSELEFTQFGDEPNENLAT